MCIRYGLKGKIDATIQLKMSDHHGNIDSFMSPFELKTGRVTNSIEHRAQVSHMTIL